MLQWRMFVRATVRCWHSVPYGRVVLSHELDKFNVKCMAVVVESDGSNGRGWHGNGLGWAGRQAGRSDVLKRDGSLLGEPASYATSQSESPSYRLLARVLPAAIGAWHCVGLCAQV
jgi:hypothetical protein